MEVQSVGVMVTTETKLSMDQLEHYLVAAALADTDQLEHIGAKFRDRLSGRLSSVFNAAWYFYEVARGLMTRSAFASILMANEPDLSKHEEYLALYDLLTNPPYSDLPAETRSWYVHEFDNQWKINTTGQILTSAAHALRHGHFAHDRDLIGPEAAWQVLAEARVDYENQVTGGSATSIDLSTTTEAARSDYREAQLDKSAIICSIPEVNEVLGGIRPGDMVVVAGYAGEGKSFVILNHCYDAWLKGHNVAIATGEMNVRKYRSRLVALHSTHSKFPRPLLTTQIDRGTLSKEDHELFLEVLADIASRGDGEYGRFFVHQFPWRATPAMIFNQFTAFDKIVPVHYVGLDYLGLLTSEHRRASRREELDDLIRQTKQLAVDFAGGRGIPLLTGYQTNRTSWMQARNDGYYTLSCFAESSEVEKSADAAWWILNEQQNPEEIKCGFVKNRDGELGESFHVRRIFQHALLKSLQTTRMPSGATASPQEAGFDLLS